MSQAELVYSTVVPSFPSSSSRDLLRFELDETERALAAAAGTAAVQEDEKDETVLELESPIVTATTRSTTKATAVDPYVQLMELGQTAEELLLAKDISAWMAATVDYDDDEDDDNEEEEEEDDDDFDYSARQRQAEQCERLGVLLRRHTVTRRSPLFQKLYQEEFLPTVEYLKRVLLFDVRRSLRRSGYPSLEGCAELMNEYYQGEEERKTSTTRTTTTSTTVSAFSQLATAAEWLHRLEVERVLTVAHAQGTSPTLATDKVDDLVVELCRPFLERIRHHFVTEAATDEKIKQQQQQQRIDRLPEWLFLFLRENVFTRDEEQDGPWDLIHYGLTPAIRPNLSVDFANEMIRLVQWVLAQRNFFRHPVVAGPNSQPMVLLQAIEQFLRFDDFISELTGKHLSGRVLSLMDIYVAGDDELLNWWMEREREAVFDSLFHGKILMERIPIHRVSPRAELFCSILRSIKRKAVVFSFSGPYLNQVAAPLCMQFLDAVHDSATDLKADLFSSFSSSSSSSVSSKKKLPTATVVQSNVRAWIELINGTHMSAELLMTNPDEYGECMDDDDDDDDDDERRPGAGSKLRSTAHQDMLRFGQSLQRLERVFVEEFASAFVETLLMETAKLANYLMRCSHMLSSSSSTHDDDGNDDGNDNAPDASPDLVNAQYLMNAFLEAVREEESMAFPSVIHARNAAYYASRLLRDRVLTLISEKFLEVALDWHGTTPDLHPAGAAVFGSDVKALFGEALLPPQALRLLDVTRCMAMNASQLNAVGDALCGLAGEAGPPLTEDMFAIDERVYEEAESMVRAKNLVWMPLGDFLSIFNRRHDIITHHVGW